MLGIKKTSSDSSPTAFFSFAGTPPIREIKQGKCSSLFYLHEVEIRGKSKNIKNVRELYKECGEIFISSECNVLKKQLRYLLQASVIYREIMHRSSIAEQGCYHVAIGCKIAIILYHISLRGLDSKHTAELGDGREYAQAAHKFFRRTAPNESQDIALTKFMENYPVLHAKPSATP